MYIYILQTYIYIYIYIYKATLFMQNFTEMKSKFKSEIRKINASGESIAVAFT